MTNAECVEQVSRMRRAYPNATVPADTLALYVEMLQDLDVEQMRSAVNALIVSSKWLPTIAEIRDFVARAKLALPCAQEAWCDALRVIRRQVTSEGVHPLVAQCVAMIGHRKIEDGGQQQTFIRLFESLAENARKNELMPTNMRDGSEGPKRIGEIPVLPPHVQARD